MHGERGVCIWFTGRSGAGKSTVTKALLPMLEAQERTVTVLDVVPLLAKQPSERTSEGKLLRKAFVAGEVARHGGIAICVTVSAGSAVRRRAREIVGSDHFVEVHLDIPVEVSEARRAARGKRAPWKKRVRRAFRQVKGRAGEGLSYDIPEDPDLRLDTTCGTPDAAATAIVSVLCDRGFLHHRRSECDRRVHD